MNDNDITFTFWTWYPQEHRITLSEGHPHILGHPLEESGVTDTFLRPLMPPVEYRRMVRLLSRMLRGDTGLCLLEVAMKNASGKLVQVEIHAQVEQRDDEGRVLRVHGLLESLPEKVWFTPRHPKEILSWHWHLPSGEVGFSGSGRDLFGYSAGELDYSFTSWLRQIHSDDVAVVNDAIAAHLSGRSEDIHYTARIRHKNGEWLWIFCSGGIVERTSEGVPLVVECSLHNVTRNNSQAQELHRLQSITDQAMQTASMSFWVWDMKKRTLIPGPGFMELLGYPEETPFTVRLLKKRLHANDIAPFVQTIRNSLNKEISTARIRFRFCGKNGDWRWFAGSGSVIEHDSSGRPLLACGIIQDISREKNQERELRRSRRKLQFSINAAGLGTWEWNTGKREIYVNERWGQILGWEETPATIDEKTFFDLLHPDDIAPAIRRFNRHVNGDSEYYRTEFRMKHADGNYIWVFSQGQVINRNSLALSPPWAIGIHQDISERRRHQKELERLASRDFLTGCGNRLYFDTVFEQEHLAIKADPQRHAALAIVDIDHFKAFNDNYGHHCGDLVLKEMSRVLMEEVEDHGLVARIGGEEFGIILLTMTAEQAVEFVDRIRRRIKKLDLATLDPALAQEQIRITAGITAILPEQEQRAIFQAADRALYEGKRQGRDQVQMTKPAHR